MKRFLITISLSLILSNTVIKSANASFELATSLCTGALIGFLSDSQQNKLKGHLLGLPLLALYLKGYQTPYVITQECVGNTGWVVTRVGDLCIKSEVVSNKALPKAWVDVKDGTIVFADNQQAVIRPSRQPIIAGIAGYLLGTGLARFINTRNKPCVIKQAAEKK